MSYSRFREYEQFFALMGTIILVGAIFTVCLFRMASCTEKRDARINQIVVVP